MFIDFASGYYCSRYWVCRDDAQARINDQEYEQLKEQVYDGDDPVVMKLGATHFPVIGDAEVPARTVFAPTKAIKESGVTQVPGKAPVLLAKKRHADRVLDLEADFGPDNDISAI